MQAVTTIESTDTTVTNKLLGGLKGTSAKVADGLRAVRRVGLSLHFASQLCIELDELKGACFARISIVFNMVTKTDIQEMKVMAAPAIAPALLKQRMVARVGD